MRDKQESKVKVKYLAWLSSKGEMQEYLDGAIYSGLVSNLPKELIKYKDENETMNYIIIMR